MAQTYNRLLIDVNQKINNIVTAKQNDTASRFLDVSLYSNGVPINLTGHSVKIYFKKSDNTEVFTEGEVTDATAGRCQFELTTQTLAVYGDLKAEISIWNGDTEVLTTQTFTITVFEMLRSDNTVESRNEFGVLVTLFQSIQNSLDMMNAIKTNFGEAGEKATEYGATTFWKMLEALAEKTEEAIQLDVSGKIGTSSDAASGTVFGNMAVAKNNINSNIDSKIAALQTYLAGIIGIKSIQRGTFLKLNPEIAISIDSVNPLKCFVIIHSSPASGNTIDSGCYVKSLTSTSIVISNYLGTMLSGSWQVIEFN